MLPKQADDSQEFNIPPVQGRNIRSIVNKFELTGSVADAHRSGRPISATSDEKHDQLLASLQRSPQKSTRRLSLELGICQKSVVNLLRKNGFRPYKPRLVHALYDGDADRRLQYAEGFLILLRHDESLLDRIWWSDEATFKLNGHINKHNCVYWATDNPHMTIEQEVNLPGVTVWAAISSRGIIGPFFFDHAVNGSNYLDMLKEQFHPLVQDQQIYFQQDGAPAHYATRVREWLDNNFTGRWIGRRGPIEFPARSPDLTPMDFFMWGVLKDLVYSRRPRTLPELRDVITNQMRTISIEMCEKVCRSVVTRLELCIEHNGEQFEHFE